MRILETRRAYLLATILITFVAAVALSPAAAIAAPPVVKTVPWVASNALIPHDTWSGKVITLKGISDVQGATIQWTWDFGDGTAIATGTVTNRYVIEATHAYTGIPGTIFTARLTVQNTGTGEAGSKEYYVEIREKALPVEVNVAIDEGLWYLHKTQRRTSVGGKDFGDWFPWASGQYASSGFYGVSALNVNAFEVNGHLESGSPDNPYTETVQRGMRRLFEFLYTDGAIPALQTNPLGSFNPDSNGNGYGVFVNQSYAYYQGGMFMDAIIASGTPGATVLTGQAPSLGNPGIYGRTYTDIVRDMADAYNYCQYDSSPGGAWRYNCNEYPDQSASQWGAIGLIPAERLWGIAIPPIVKNWNKPWLAYTQQPSTGIFGYTGTGPVWGPYATTPSGMVQMAMDGIGRGSAGAPSWDKAETFMRDNFCRAGGPTVAVLDYYYGLFSFVKALLLHDSNADGAAEPIRELQSSTPGVAPIDWYSAESAGGDPCDGVARTLVNDQNAAGYWYGHNMDGNQMLFETAMAIIMLNRTIFEAGAPVAVAQAIPNPAVAGQLIILDGSASFHQDPSKSIDSWEWDLNNDGTFDVSGPFPMTSFSAIGDYPVRLRVTDDADPESSAETVITVRVTTPPIAPTANAGGPYLFCMNKTPWFLDGSGSVNPDDGVSEPGRPVDAIQEYAWELNGDGSFNDAFGVTPNVTGFWGVGSYLIQLRVKDKTATSFPSSGQPNLTDTDSAQVFVMTDTNPACASCISDLAARPKSGKVQLTWSPQNGIHHYNVYRGTVSGGPYLKIGSTASTYSTYLDQAVVNGTTYYYVVRTAAINENETCQSNQASARPTALAR